jgi:hypothetical protein
LIDFQGVNNLGLDYVRVYPTLKRQYNTSILYIVLGESIRQCDISSQRNVIGRQIKASILNQMLVPGEKITITIIK